MKIRSTLSCGILLLFSEAWLAAAAHSSPAPVTLFAIDVQAYPLQRHVTLFLTKPVVRREPVLSPSTSPDAPDNAAVYVYGTVLHEGGLFRMWYYGLPFTTPEGGLGECPILYAESRDGLHWNRPNLRQVEWRGSRDNNLIALGDRNSPQESGRLVDASKIKGITGLSLIRDDDDPRRERRYKMIYEQKGIGTAMSPDGIHWTDLPKSHLPEGEPSGLYKYGGYYFVSCHLGGRGEGDREEGREAYAWVSTDFEHWQPETVPSFKTPEPMVGSGWGTDAKGRWVIPTGLGLYTQDHLGIAAIPAGSVLIGLYGMWNQRLPLWGEGGISGDLGLIISHDGFFFNEVVKGRPYITSEESAAEPMPGRNYPTILTQSNGILNVGNETWIYHGRWRNSAFRLRTSPPGEDSQDYYGAIALARLPRDRWGALGLWASQNTGSVWTQPLTLPAHGRLVLNASGLSGLRLAVGNEEFHALSGFAEGRPDSSIPDAFDAEVTWGGHTLSEIGGKTVRFHIFFARSAAAEPRLFAAYLAGP